MKVLVTGNYGLGKNIHDTLTEHGHSVTCMSSIDSYAHHIPSVIDDFDVFINNEYREHLQTFLFELVYSRWEYSNKTIVNILTSAIVFGGTNVKYIEDKRQLEQKTISLRSDRKKVRVTNIYPNTLESTKNVPYSKLKYQEVSNIINWVLSLPQEIEIFQLGISKTCLIEERGLI